MDLTEANKIHNAFLIYINVKSFYKKTELENGYDEFKSLTVSSGLTLGFIEDVNSYLELYLCLYFLWFSFSCVGGRILQIKTKETIDFRVSIKYIRS